jgi:hypothetical protein
VEHVCLVLPVQVGRSSDAREFMRELEASRKDEYARSEESIGITKEVWFLAGVGGGDTMVALYGNERLRTRIAIVLAVAG